MYNPNDHRTRELCFLFLDYVMKNSRSSKYAIKKHWLVGFMSKSGSSIIIRRPIDQPPGLGTYLLPRGAVNHETRETSSAGITTGFSLNRERKHIDATTRHKRPPSRDV